MREARIKKTKTVCTFCGVGCSFEVWTKGPSNFKNRTVKLMHLLMEFRLV